MLYKKCRWKSFVQTGVCLFVLKMSRRYAFIRRYIEFNEENKENCPVCVLCNGINQENEFLIYMCFCSLCINKMEAICIHCVYVNNIFTHSCVCMCLHRYSLLYYRS